MKCKIAQLIKFGLQLILQSQLLFRFYDQLYGSKSLYAYISSAFRVAYKYLLIGVIIVGAKIATQDGGDSRDVLTPTALDSLMMFVDRESRAGQRR
jgi:hypothetical protein